MKEKKIGVLLLSGLIIGPLLGSGIVLLPTMAYQSIGNYALLAWILIMILGMFFAAIFSKLSVKFTGHAGMANAVEHAFGIPFKNLTSVFLTIAASLGPVASMTLAGEYLNLTFPSSLLKPEIYSFFVIILCFFILTKNLEFVGKISLILTSLITIILLSCSIFIIFNNPINISISGTNFNFSNFWQTILLLFWSIVGWEVIGNYSEEVKNPTKTIKVGVLISCLIITALYIIVGLALQTISTGNNIENMNLSILLVPVFGKWALPIMTLITVSLCVTTYLLFVGSAARLVNSQAIDGNFPKFLSKTTNTGIPIIALCFFTIVHCLDVLLIYYKFLSIENIITFANVFFICNALLGVLASMKLFRDKLNRLMTSILSSAFFILLFLSEKWLILIVAIMFLIAIYQIKKTKHIKFIR